MSKLYEHPFKMVEPTLQEAPHPRPIPKSQPPYPKNKLFDLLLSLP